MFMHINQHERMRIAEDAECGSPSLGQALALLPHFYHFSPKTLFPVNNMAVVCGVDHV